jgi:5,5'-dehydrodivanillate O-demethylase
MAGSLDASRADIVTPNQRDTSSIKVNDLAYTGPATVAGKYLRKFWHPVCQSHKLAAGEAVEIRVMGENWTLFRGDSGNVHAVGDRCAHRTVKLSVGWVEGDAVRCFYHGWKYDGKGRCVEQPSERQPFCERVRLRSAHAQEYLGLIFAYFGPGEPPELPRYPEFENAGAHVQTFNTLHNFNYFNAIDNLLDASHIGFVHSNHAGGFDGRIDKTFLQVEETCWGATSVHTRQSSGKTGQTQFGMPNIFRVRMFPLAPKFPPREVIFWFIPIDDESYQRFFIEVVNMPRDALAPYLAARKEVLKKQTMLARDLAEDVVSGRKRRQSVEQDSTNYVNFVDDVAQLAQGRIHDRTFERLGSSDVGMLLVRKIWLRELAAFREGRELTPWRYDPNLPMIQADE